MVRRLAQDDDAWYATELGRYADSVEKGLLAEVAAPQPGGALDIGCGTGNHALWLADLGLEVTGLDESEPMLAEAARKSGGPPDVEEVDAAVAAVLAVLEPFRAQVLSVEVGSMSTVLRRPDEHLLERVRV